LIHDAGRVDGDVVRALLQRVTLCDEGRVTGDRRGLARGGRPCSSRAERSRVGVSRRGAWMKCSREDMLTDGGKDAGPRDVRSRRVPADEVEFVEENRS
jgi:hypothetical protein